MVLRKHFCRLTMVRTMQVPNIITSTGRTSVLGNTGIIKCIVPTLQFANDIRNYGFQEMHYLFSYTAMNTTLSRKVMFYRLQTFDYILIFDHFFYTALCIMSTRFNIRGCYNISKLLSKKSS